MPVFDADWQRFHTSGGFSDRRHPLLLAALSDIFPHVEWHSFSHWPFLSHGKAKIAVRCQGPCL